MKLQIVGKQEHRRTRQIKKVVTKYPSRKHVRMPISLENFEDVTVKELRQHVEIASKVISRAIKLEESDSESEGRRMRRRAIAGTWRKMDLYNLSGMTRKSRASLFPAEVEVLSPLLAAGATMRGDGRTKRILTSTVMTSSSPGMVRSARLLKIQERRKNY